MRGSGADLGPGPGGPHPLGRDVLSYSPRQAGQSEVEQGEPWTTGFSVDLLRETLVAS